jgi:hypothetical protein
MGRTESFSLEPRLNGADPSDGGSLNWAAAFGKPDSKDGASILLAQNTSDASQPAPTPSDATAQPAATPSDTPKSPSSPTDSNSNDVQLLPTPVVKMRTDGSEVSFCKDGEGNYFTFAGDQQHRHFYYTEASQTLELLGADGQKRDSFDLNIETAAVNAAKGGVLNLDFQDPKFSETLNTVNNYLPGDAGYSRIVIANVPDGVTLGYGLDEKGPYFKFSNDPNQVHHSYLPSAKHLIVNYKDDQDLAQICFSSSDDFAHNIGGVEQAPNYFYKMTSMDQNLLQQLDDNLSGAQKQSNNPYFRIYQADVKAAEILKPLIDAEKNNEPIRGLITYDVIDKINKVMPLLKAGQDCADGIAESAPNTQEAGLFRKEVIDDINKRKVALTMIMNYMYNGKLP